MGKQNTLIIITNSFPFESANEQTFILPELPHHTKYFDKVIIVPGSTEGKKYPVPAGVEVVENYARISSSTNRNKAVYTFRTLTSKEFYYEIYQYPWVLYHKIALKRVILFLGEAKKFRNWIRRFLLNRGLINSNLIVYTYWFYQYTYGICLLRKEFPWIKVISRAHGYDIYDERWAPPYQPFRMQTLSAINQLFVASKHGMDYLRSKFPSFKDKIKTLRVCIPGVQFSCRSSRDNVFRMVSCSSLIPLKRVELLLLGIISACKKERDEDFEWHHFGEGPCMPKIREIISDNKLDNLRSTLYGQVDNHQITDFYRENPVDVFLHVSKTEGGTSVAVMEAISAGIPVIATSVGGVPEIVREENGVRLGPSGKPDEIANAILKLKHNPELLAEKRRKSKEVWQAMGDSNSIYPQFSERIASLAKNSPFVGSNC